MATADSSNSTAFKTFSLENSILNVPPQDEIFRFDPEANQQILSAQPWKNEYGILCDDSAGYRNNNGSFLVTITLRLAKYLPWHSSRWYVHHVSA